MGVRSVIFRGVATFFDSSANRSFICLAFNPNNVPFLSLVTRAGGYYTYIIYYYTTIKTTTARIAVLRL